MLALLLTAILAAVTNDVFVPADYPTIQDALDAVSDGDRILVSPGLYDENLDFQNKQVELISTDGAAVTTIDGGLRGSVVVFRGLESTSARLEGFTVRNGYGFEIEGYRRGGGLQILNGASPTITDNVIEQCEAEWGGGIYAQGRDDDSGPAEPRVIGNTIRANQGRVGGGVYCSYVDGEWLNNVIESNVASSEGGGLRVTTVTYRLEGNLIRDNQAGTRGGGCYDAISNSRVLDNRFENNHALLGGGLYLSFTRTTFERNRILDNHASSDGGGVYHDYGSFIRIRFCDNLLARNHAADEGGGFYCEDEVVDLTGCTIVANSSDHRGGGIWWNQSGATYGLDRSIVWGNTAPVAPNLGVEQGSLTVDGCDVEGGQAGVYLGGGGSLNWTGGSFDADPLFTDAGSCDYSLTASSPCIDFVSSDVTATGVDLAGTPRLLDGNLDGVRRLDLGALEFSNVQLTVSGNATPGGTLQLDATGLAGLTALLWFGLQPGEVDIDPFGPLLVDLSQFQVLPLGTLPVSLQADIPLDAPPVSLTLQCLAIDPPTGTGNFSNTAPVEIE